MKVIIEDNKEEEQAIIVCKSITKDIMLASSLLQGNDGTIIGRIQDKIQHVRFKDILYFEAVDNKVFFHTVNDSFDTKYKLYEIESEFSHLGFLRISKAFILNLHKIDHLEPAFNGRFEATLINQEKIVISRQYVKKFKQILQIK